MQVLILLNFLTNVLNWRTSDCLIWPNYSTRNQNFEPLIATIDRQRNVETLVCIGTENSMDMASLAQWPKLIWQPKNLQYAKLTFKMTYNKEILVLLAITEQQSIVEINELWNNLSQIFNEMRHSTRLIIYLHHQQQHEQMAHHMFNIAWEHKFVDMIAVFGDFNDTQLIYGFVPFSQTNLSVFEYKRYSTIFANVFQNLNGHEIRTIADQLEPRSFLYIDERGKQHLTGYVFNLLKVFAEKLNATLVYPRAMQMGNVLFYDDVARQTRANLFDLPATLIPSTGIYEVTALTYPYEQLDYCTMVPIPPHLPVRDIYVLCIDPMVQSMLVLIGIIYSGIYFLIEHAPTYQTLVWYKFPIFKLEVTRTFFDQPIMRDVQLSWKLKCLFFQIFWLWFFINAFYGSYLGSLLTCPPMQEYVKTLEDFTIRHHGIIAANNEWKMFVTLNEYADEVWLQPIARSAIKTRTFNEFLRMRNSMNPAYAYPVTSIRWFYFEERQRFFERPLFYYEDRFCFAKLVLMSIPLQNNSIYVEPLNHAILQIHESGLMRKWLSDSLFEMIKMKRIPREDLSPPLTYGGQIKQEDLTDLFIVLCYGLAISTCFFAFEYYWYLIKKCRKIKFKKIKFHIKWKK